MTRVCAVVGCVNRSNRDTNKKYFSFPGVKDRRGRDLPDGVKQRELWIAALHRKDFPEKKIRNARICSDHFISGYPSNNSINPDYVPNLKMGYGTASNPAAKRARYERAKNRDILSSCHNKATTVAISCDNAASIETPTELTDVEQQINVAATTSTQTDNAHIVLLQELKEAKLTIAKFKKKLESLNTTADCFAGDDKKTNFFTGLPTYRALSMVVGLFLPYLSKLGNLSPFQQILLTLMRLRLNVSFRFLGYHFDVHESTASRIFLRTLHVMYLCLKDFIVWPERDELINSMPTSFKEHFNSKVTVIVDCFEVKIEKGTNLHAQASTWSNYKHDNTMKLLLGITPNGSISFISRGYGGRIGDKKLTEDCGILDNLLPGDLILADRGFLIQEIVKIMYGADVKTPAFLKSRRQLENKEIEDTRHLAAVRIHVERVIGFLRQKYQILHHTVPLTLLKRKCGNTNVIDEIVTVCAALINLCPGIVPL